MTQVTTMNTLVKCLQLAAVSLTVLAANQAQAAIVGGSANLLTRSGLPIEPVDITVLDPPPSTVQLNLIESKNVLSFNEQQNVTLSEDVMVWDGFDRSKAKIDPNVLIPTGSFVSSHFIFFDPPGGRHFWEGTIDFDSEIIGIVGRRGQFSPTRNLLGLADTTYDMTGVSALGLDTNRTRDDITDVVSFEGNTLSFYITAGNLGLDPLRVITNGSQVTAAVPEPLTVLGTGTALGFIPVLKRAYSRKQKKTKKKG